MKIVIISDTHGSYRNADKVVEKEWPFDRLIQPVNDMKLRLLPAVVLLHKICQKHALKILRESAAALNRKACFLVHNYNIFVLINYFHQGGSPFCPASESCFILRIHIESKVTRILCQRLNLEFVCSKYILLCHKMRDTS